VARVDETTPTADYPEILDWLSGLGGAALRIAIIILVAAVVHFLGSRIIKRSVGRWIARGRSREDSLTDTPEATVELRSMLMSQRREQRAHAVGQLLNSLLAFTVWGTAGLVILTEIGVNIGPVLASAGVVGVALGFGAQTLVKDYLSGFFLIVEDQYGVGDLVDLGEVTGRVEEVGLRVTRVRDLTGVVWYFRNGEIIRVANQSQGWTMASAVIPVSYNADLAKVRQVVAEVGNDMFNDPETRERLLGRPIFAGVEAVSGEAVFIKVLAKARGGQQLPLTRELRERLKSGFDARGIVVPMMTRPMGYNADGTPFTPGAGAPGGSP
jgi:small conductance mechanosensitive channel